MEPDLLRTRDELRVNVVPARAEVHVVPVGALDVHTVGPVEEAVRELREAGFETIVVDLRGLDFLDSSGLGMLLSLRNTARRTGHRLELIRGSRLVQRVFELTATVALFDWRDVRDG
ncbi:MAG TPA: STAS domain-containing protein [Solirubrobacteraceae bacterium]|nr:STAS domain-containing protein [Solirubrobacteraceae bacterium]